MRRLFDLRIVRWERKLAFAIVIWFLPAPFFWALPVEVAGHPFVQLFGSVISVLTFLLAARVFRGKGEAIQPARPWWKMTARSTLSVALGTIFAVYAALFFLGGFVTALGVTSKRSDMTAVDYAVQLPFVAALAFLYINSARRLLREERDALRRPALS